MVFLMQCSHFFSMESKPRHIARIPVDDLGYNPALPIPTNDMILDWSRRYPDVETFALANELPPTHLAALLYFAYETMDHGEIYKAGAENMKVDEGVYLLWLCAEGLDEQAYAQLIATALTEAYDVLTSSVYSWEYTKKVVEQAWKKVDLASVAHCREAFLDYARLEQG